MSSPPQHDAGRRGRPPFARRYDCTTQSGCYGKNISWPRDIRHLQSTDGTKAGPRVNEVYSRCKRRLRWSPVGGQWLNVNLAGKRIAGSLLMDSFQVPLNTTARGTDRSRAGCGSNGFKFSKFYAAATRCCCCWRSRRRARRPFFSPPAAAPAIS